MRKGRRGEEALGKEGREREDGRIKAEGRGKPEERKEGREKIEEARMRGERRV